MVDKHTVDEPTSNFQCPKCGSLSVVNRTKYEKAGLFGFLINDKRNVINSKTLVCLKCNWEHDKFKEN